MSKIQWEYDLVERSFCEQLKAMGWQWIEGQLCWLPSPISDRISRFWQRLRWLTNMNKV